MKTLFLAISALGLWAAGAERPGIPYTISTVAGGGDCGDDGPASLARLGAPEGFAIDRAGNLYVSDALDHRVRKISPSGIVSTVAGTGRPGFRGDGGPATAARLNAPYGLAVDAAGNLYIADLGNARIRQVSPEGIIWTFAGGDSAGIRLTQPRNLALDGSGNLYVSDFGDHSVYRFAAGGGVSRIAGTGSPGSVDDGVAVEAALAPLRSPAGIALDRSGALYIADSGNHRVRKVLNRLLTTVRSSPAELDTPTGLAIDGAGNLYVSDKGFSVIWKLTPSLSRFAGTGVPGNSGDGGQAILARFDQPREIAFDGSGNLYVADTNGSAGLIRRVLASGTVVAFAGGLPIHPSGDDGPATSAYLDAPAGLALDAAGDLYVADRLGHRVRRVSSGVITTAAGIGYPGSGGDGGFAFRAQLDQPEGIALDTAGNLWVAEQGTGRIRKIDTTARIFTFAMEGLNSPSGIAADPDGNLYVADGPNHVVRKLTPDGQSAVFAGAGLPGYDGDTGPAASALLRNPHGLCFDTLRNLYIADSGNHVIRKVAPDGVITTVAGRGESWFGGDGGPATSAWLNMPSAVAADAQGNLYIADTGNERVRRVDTKGIIETIAGTGARGYSGDGGPGLDAELDEPAGIAVDAEGAVYVADRGNGLIRKLTPAPLSPPPVVEEPAALSVASLVNAASGLPGPIAPGEIVTVYGTALDGAQVFVEDEVSTLLFAGPSQINFVVPQSAAGRAATEIEVRTPAASLRLIVQAADANPGVFTLAGGSGQAAAENGDGAGNSAESPAPRGSVLTFYATGEGTGKPIAVEIGGERAAILSATHAAGVLRVSVRIPGSCPSGNLPVRLGSGEAWSQSGVTVAVR